MRTTTIFCVLFLLIAVKISAQCGVPDTAGSTANILTIINNANRPIAADPSLNTVVMGYRQNDAIFTGNSGLLRYSLSTDGGASWSKDQGPVNPLNTSQGRFPNTALYNPASNTTPTLGYLVYKAPTFNPSAGWDGKVSGVRRLDGTGNTESYNAAGPGTVVPLTSLTKGAPGEFWACGRENVNAIAGDKIEIYKGSWTSSNDVAWTTHTVITLPVLAVSPVIGDINIAFDPAGLRGWISAAAHFSNMTSQNKRVPVLYGTSDGGATWEGPIILDPGNFSCFTASLGANPDPGLDGQSSLVVDAYGNPHMLVVAGASDNNHDLDYTKWHGLLDITRVDGLWAIHTVAALRTAPYTLPGGAGDQEFTPQASRSADGTKVFFTWSDNVSLSQGASMSSPEMFGRGLDVSQKIFTGIRNFTSCNPAVAGKTWLMHAAAEVLEYSNGVYKVAPMFLQSPSGNNSTQPWNVLFLDNCTFSVTEFTVPVAQPSFTVAPPLYSTLCLGDSLVLTVGGSISEVRWFEGTSTTTLSVNGHGTYAVTVREGCNVGTATFSVDPLILNTSVSSVTICPAETVTLVASGNGTGYTWEPGQVIGSTLITTPQSSVVYTVSTFGTGTCYTTAVIEIKMEECTGLQEQLNDGISVYPVPAGDRLNVESDSERMLTLYNSLGMSVKSISLSPGTTVLSTAGLPRGVYLIVIQDKTTPVIRVILE